MKYTGKRFIDDMNTATMPGNTTLNFDSRMPITWWGLQNTYLQLNVYNLTNTRYPTRVSSVSNANNVIVGNTTIFAKSYFYTYDSRRGPCSSPCTPSSDRDPRLEDRGAVRRRAAPFRLGAVLDGAAAA